MIVLDSHCDTPSQVVRLRDLGLDNRLAHIDFPKLKAGKVDACFFALYTSQSKPRQEALPYVWKMLALMQPLLLLQQRFMRIRLKA